MTTFQPIILVCPFCKQQMYVYQLASVTIYKSNLYSDNKIETEPYIDTDNAIKVCPSCNQNIWLEDAVLEVENPYELSDKLPKAVDIIDFLFKMDGDFRVDLIKYYEKILKQGFASNNEKKYWLRTRLWWAINDLIRNQVSFLKLFRKLVSERRIFDFIKSKIHQKKLFHHYNTLFRENIEQLIKLVNPDDEGAYFLLAEMHREIGQFRKARHYINKVEDRNHVVVKKMKKVILVRKKSVFKV